MALFQPPITEFQTQHFEVTLFLPCMQMSKNQLGHRLRPAAVWFLGSPFVTNLKKVHFAFIPLLVGVAGFEPATLRLSSACSNQLSYTPGFASPVLPLEASPLVEVRGLEPLTYSLQSYRSTN